MMMMIMYINGVVGYETKRQDVVYISDRGNHRCLQF